MFVLHGTNDSLVPIEQGRAFAAKMREVNRRRRWLSRSSLLAQHAFDFFGSVRAPATAEAIERFLGDDLRPRAAGVKQRAGQPEGDRDSGERSESERGSPTVNQFCGERQRRVARGLLEQQRPVAHQQRRRADPGDGDELDRRRSSRPAACEERGLRGRPGPRRAAARPSRRGPAVPAAAPCGRTDRTRSRGPAARRARAARRRDHARWLARGRRLVDGRRPVFETQVAPVRHVEP